MLTLLVRADGLLVVPAGVEGHHAGTEVSVELLRGLDEIARTVVAIGSHDLVFDLHSDRFQSAVYGLGGYSVKEMGRRIR